MSRPEPVGREARTLGAPGPAHTGGTVLLVDDDRSVRKVTARYLAQLGYTVLEAADAADALALAHAGSGVDVVVSDIAMPGIRGPVLVRELQRRRPAIPAVLITGYAEEALQREDWPPGVVLLEKPFDVNQLRECLNECRTRAEDGRKGP